MSSQSSNEKKRKREKDKSSKSSEKKTKTSKAVKVKVAELKKSDVGPFLVTFPQGPPPESVLTNSTGGLQFTFNKETNYDPNQGRGEVSEMKATSPSIQVEYKGRNFGGTEESLMSMNKYFIGIRSKSKNTVKLVEVPTLYAMKQEVKSYTPDIKGNKYKDVDRMTRRVMLVNTFASTRQKRALKQSLANQLNDKTSMIFVDFPENTQKVKEKKKKK